MRAQLGHLPSLMSARGTNWPQTRHECDSPRSSWSLFDMLTLSRGAAVQSRTFGLAGGDAASIAHRSLGAHSGSYAWVRCNELSRMSEQVR